MNLTIRLARHQIRMEHRYAYIRTMAADFAIDETPLLSDNVMTVAVTDADLAHERAVMGTNLSAEYAEYLAMERAVSRALAPLGVCHMHAVAVAVDGEAYVFLADSGVGKTTHATAWTTLLGDRASIICDDKPFFSYEADTLWIHASPWKGREGIGRNVSMPVKAFCVLTRGASDAVAPLPLREATGALFRHIFLPEDPAGAAAVLSFADRVLTSIPFFGLCATPTVHAAEAAYLAMSKRSTL